MRNCYILAAFGLLLGSSTIVSAGEIPPAGSKPLSVIVKAVEDKGLGRISEVEFDDGLWEVKVCKGSACQKLYFNPKSGKETRRRRSDADETPPAKAKRLSVIIKSVEARAQGKITEAEFEDGSWEVELRKDGRKIRLVIDPITGKTRP